MRLYELIVEGYREAQHEFSAPANNDIQGVKELIQAYKDLVNKNQITGIDRNIDTWRKKGFEEFKKFVVSKIKDADIKLNERESIALAHELDKLDKLDKLD